MEQSTMQSTQIAGMAIDPACEDDFWRGAYADEAYYSPALDYEDYAPAYCVGYAGCLQYGGTFEDARHSLVANWMRIRGDSRLSLEQALAAMRAAWDRLALSAVARVDRAAAAVPH